MRRLAVLVALLGFVVIGVILLFWFGAMFRSYLDPGKALVVHAPEPRHLPTGSPFSFHLTGAGFDRDTRVSLVMDVSNQDMVIHRYPVDGFFNTSLMIDDLLLLGSNDGLMLLSVADPESPRLLETYLSGRSVLDLHYADGLLFVSCGRLGLAVMALEDNRLSVTAEIWTGDTATASYFHAGHLYVNTYAGGLIVYAMTEAMQMRQVGKLRHDNIVRGMAFYDDRLFLYDRHGTLYLYDCSNPASLRQLGQVHFESMVRSILVKNAMLHVALADSFRIFDLTDPDQPDLVRVWDDFGSINRLIEGRNHVYLVDRSVGLRMLDSRDLSMSAQISFAEGLQTLSERDGLLYATGSLDGLLTIDRQRLRSRQVVTWIDGVSRVNDGLVSDHIFYLSSATGAAYVEKNNGSVHGFTDARERTTAFSRYQNLIFTAQATGGVKVFDVTIPDRPQLIADWPNYSVSRMQVVGDLLISSSLRSGLMVTAIADVGSAPIVDHIDAPQIVAMATEGDYLFCVAYDNGLLTYRVHPDGKLRQVSHMTPPFPANRFDHQVDIDVKDGIAYIANGNSGLMIVDVKNPLQPQLVSALGVPGYSKGVRIHEDMVYLVTLRDGIFIVDVSALERPLLVGSLPLSRLSRFLLVDEGMLYFFQDASGMSAIPLPRFAQQQRLRSHNQLEVIMAAPDHPGRYNLQVSNRSGLVGHHAVFEFY